MSSIGSRPSLVLAHPCSSCIHTLARTSAFVNACKRQTCKGKHTEASPSHRRREAHGIDVNQTHHNQVGGDDKHSIAVYDWQRSATPLFYGPGHVDEVVMIRHNPFDQDEFIQVLICSDMHEYMMCVCVCFVQCARCVLRVLIRMLFVQRA
jgi:hypothetical protein